MPLVERQGLSLHVQLLGAGPPLVMLHGLLVGSVATWWFGAAPKLARAHRVLLADLRGHGLSSHAESGYGLASLADDLAALLPLAGEGRVTLVGHSWGALVALRFALAHPERVAKLVLVEAPLPPSRLTELESFLSATPAEQLAAVPDAVRAMAARSSRRGSKTLAQVARLVTTTTLLEDLRREPDFAESELARLSCETLLIYGDRSSCLPSGERLARTLPHAELITLPGGHFLPAEQASALASLLEERLCLT